MVTLNDIKKDPLVISYIKKADEYLERIGYTEHGNRHSNVVAKNTSTILLKLGRPEREAELAGIAGYLHDIGNVVSREDHPQTGAILVEKILSRLDMDINEISEVMMAIGNHEEADGNPVSNVTAALIIADKADVHRSRVRTLEFIKFDIHDRVNYAAKKSFLKVNQKSRTITLSIEIDTKISPVMEYFEIFLSRMVISRRAAEFLGCTFELIINGTKII